MDRAQGLAAGLAVAKRAGVVDTTMGTKHARVVYHKTAWESKIEIT
jgi:hypothetical protein